MAIVHLFCYCPHKVLPMSIFFISLLFISVRFIYELVNALMEELRDV